MTLHSSQEDESWLLPNSVDPIHRRSGKTGYPMQGQHNVARKTTANPVCAQKNGWWQKQVFRVVQARNNKSVREIPGFTPLCIIQAYQRGEAPRSSTVFIWQDWGAMEGIIGIGIRTWNIRAIGGLWLKHIKGHRIQWWWDCRGWVCLIQTR